MGKQTDAIHGHGFRDQFGAVVPPIYQTAIFENVLKETGEKRLSDRGRDLKYSREENPTVRCLERALAKLEGCEDALCFSSGMAAISTVLLSELRLGNEILVLEELYGATLQLVEALKKFGIRVSYVYPRTEDVLDALHSGLRLVFVETMTNPTLKVLDVPEIARACMEEGIPLAVDNTFVSPILYRPLPDGATYVLHSTTKYISGNNSVVGGVLASTDTEKMRGELWDWRRWLGTVMAPFNAYLTLEGLKTLPLRVKRHSDSALQVAEFLSEHPKVSDVLYPGLPDNEYHEVAKRVFDGGLFGGVVSFRVRGGLDEAYSLMRNLKLVKATPSLGGPETMMTHPLSSLSFSHIPEERRRKLGLTENLLRMAVGLEDVEDIIEDLDRALSQI